MKVVYEWSVRVPNKNGGSQETLFRLLQGDVTLVIERREFDRRGDARWVDVKEWDQDMSLKSASDGNYSPAALLAAAVLQLVPPKPAGRAKPAGGTSFQPNTAVTSLLPPEAAPLPPAPDLPAGLPWFK